MSESNRYGAYASLLDLSHYCGMTPPIRQYLRVGATFGWSQNTPLVLEFQIYGGGSGCTPNNPLEEKLTNVQKWTISGLGFETMKTLFLAIRL